MRCLPFYPLFNLVKIIFINKGLSVRGIIHLIPWLVKTILLEPFRWIELLVFERRIARHRVHASPVFILGHYRSGTTYLQRLFMQDKRRGYMSIFQSVLPEIMLAFEKALTPLAEWSARLFKIKNPFHRIPFTWHFPGEDDVAMTALLSTRGAQWGILFPEKRKYYSRKFIVFQNATAREKEQWKKDYLYLVKKVSLQNKGRQLILKSPPHTARIRELLELFPDARFVFIHRNPFRVYASAKRLWQVSLKNYALGRCGHQHIQEDILGGYDEMMKCYLDQRSLVPPGRLLEISYHELVNTPVATMQKIYNQLGLANFNTCKKEMEIFAGRQKDHRQLKYIPDFTEQKMVSEKWHRYIEEWSYTPVTKNAAFSKL